MPTVPAICDDCGTVFGSPNLIGVAPGVTANVQFTNSKVGPCPKCGGTGSIPDGFYEFTDTTLNIFSTWPPDRLRRLAAVIQEARRTPDPRASVESALNREPDLADLARRLSPLRDPAAFWGFVAVLLATIALLTSQSDPSVTVKQETVIEKVIEQQTPTPPTAGTATKRPPPPPPRRKPKGRGKRKK